MAHDYQKKLSALSCEFIFELLEELPAEQWMCPILPLIYRVSDEGRMVLPCFFVTKVILDHMFFFEQNIFLLCKNSLSNDKERLVLFFRGDRSFNEFFLLSIKDLSLSQTGVVFSGEHQTNASEQFMSRIVSNGLRKIILCNNASHPQYSGSILYEYSENPFQKLVGEKGLDLTRDEIVVLKKLSAQIKKYQFHANYLGCSSLNRGLFFIKHIFCDSSKSYSNSPRRPERSEGSPLCGTI